MAAKAGPGENANVNVIAPDGGAKGQEEEGEGVPPAKGDVEPARPPLKQTLSGDMQDEPESMLTKEEQERLDEELSIPGSFDLSDPPRQGEGESSWGDMFKKLRLKQ